MAERGEARERAILEVAMSLLVKNGYKALTMEEIAATAHASKSTIYRRWRNKAELVNAALVAHELDLGDSFSPPDTGALRSDLFAAVEILRRRARAVPVTVLAELTRLMDGGGELADVLRRNFAVKTLSPFPDLLARAIDRGEVSATVDRDLVHDVAEAMIVHHLHRQASLDEEFIIQLVDNVLIILIGKVSMESQ